MGETQSNLKEKAILEEEEARRKEKEMMAELDRKEKQFEMEQAARNERRKLEKEERERIQREQMEQKEKDDKAIMEEKQRQRQREDQQNMLDQQQLEKQTREMNDMLNRQRTDNHQELKCQIDMNNDVVKRKEADINKIREEVRGDMLRLDNQKAELEEKLNKEKLGYIEEEKKERKENQEKLLEWEKKKLEAETHGEQMKLKHEEKMAMIKEVVQLQIGAVVVAGMKDQKEVNYVQEITNIRSCAVNFQTPMSKLRNITVALKYRAKETAMRKAKAESLVAVQTIQTLITQLSGHLSDLRDQPESNMEEVAERSDIAAKILVNVESMANPLQEYMTLTGYVSDIVEDRDSDQERRLTELVAILDAVYKKMTELINQISTAYRSNHVQVQIKENMHMLINGNKEHIKNLQKTIDEGKQGQSQ